MARAAPLFGHFKTPYISDLAVQGVNNVEVEQEWLGHVICFLRGPAALTAPHKTEDHMYLRWYMVERIDVSTKLPDLRRMATNRTSIR